MTSNGNRPPARPIPNMPPQGVPIIGAGVYMACSQGHVEKLAGPFTLAMPGRDPRTDPPTPILLCRVCVMTFMRMFGARPLDAEEVEALRESGQLDAIDRGGE